MSKCLTCKHEPDWSKSTGGEYPRQHGKCKYVVQWPKMPYVYSLQAKTLVRYSDGSGLPTSCQTWEKRKE